MIFAHIKVSVLNACNVRVCSFYYIKWRHLVNLLPLDKAVLKLKHNGLLTLILTCAASNDQSGGLCCLGNALRDGSPL